MPKNIEISNINTHFLLNSDPQSQQQSITSKKKYNTKLISRCFYSINEITICSKIKHMRYYSNKYVILEEYNFVNISQLNDQYIDKCKLNNDDKYYIFNYYDDRLVTLNSILFNIDNPKSFILTMLVSFSSILNSLLNLNNNNICFFNLSPENIVFNLDYREKPLIRNFQTSLIIPNIDIPYIANIIKKTNDYVHKPLEVHIIFYLIQNNISSVSYSFILEVCENFIKNASFLTLFSNEFIYSYKESCIASLVKYINRPTNEIIASILKTVDKWDVYSISVLYLHIFNSINNVFSLNDTFISKISCVLLKNISPDPLNRLNLQELSDMYDIIFNSNLNWSFVDNLSRDKMTSLFDILSK